MDRSYATSKDVGEESGWKMISVQIAAKDPSLRVQYSIRGAGAWRVWVTELERCRLHLNVRAAENRAQVSGPMMCVAINQHTVNMILDVATGLS